jgi:hypothetical protein
MRAGRLQSHPLFGLNWNQMNHSQCSKIVRERIRSDIRREICKSSNFACCICGDIPIVIHHIEEWANKKSNDKRYLIAICDKCHRRIHGKGGNIYSKPDLYRYKTEPKKPTLLKDKLPLEGQRGYSFFVGSNFLNDGEIAWLNLPDHHKLITIDTSKGILKLSILSGMNQDEPTYLIKENELMIEMKDIWDMQYSGNSLKIWRTIQAKKSIFIDMSLHPDVIIIKRMETTFNDVPFRIYRSRSLQKKTIDKIVNQVKECEEGYKKLSQQIDQIPEQHGVHNGIDYDAELKESQKTILKSKITRWLSYEFYKNFDMPWPQYQLILDEILQESPILKINLDLEMDFSEGVKSFNEKIRKIKEKYRKEFDSLKNTVMEYRGTIYGENMQI